MSNSTLIKREIGLFTVRQLCEKAAEFKGLQFKKSERRLCSTTIKTYTLTNDLLTHLATKGIMHEERTDTERIYTLVDTNPQQPTPGFCASNYWNFMIPREGEQPELMVELSVEFAFRSKRRGIVFFPRAFGGVCAPADDLPNFRMFSALAGSDPDVNPIAHEIASSGTLTVTWTQLGLGGLRTLDQLFAEFSNGNEQIIKLARQGQVFQPKPYSNTQTMFVTEPDQPTLFDLWDEQLTNYRASLERR